ncbi:MAG: translation initiation factor IF-2, partial [Planctomycetes bacterium]|nr:translation initiation factor IF-2 [Planctomycetota bacterium]
NKFKPRRDFKENTEFRKPAKISGFKIDSDAPQVKNSDVGEITGVKTDRTKVGKQKKGFEKKFDDKGEKAPKKAVKQRRRGRNEFGIIGEKEHEDGYYSHRKGKKKVKFSSAKKNEPINVKPKEIVLAKTATIKEVSAAFGVQMNKIISHFFNDGVMKRANDYLNEEEIVEIATDNNIEFNFQEVHSKMQNLEDDLEKMIEEKDLEENLHTRPPIVTMLGHVDHGKTSLLDYIRKSGFAKTEDGGITQHIGASVLTRPGGDIVFIDTPGHEAFTQMRARGAQLTDIAILVVAADDGVMPTTKEAYDHIKAAGVEIIVALNKIDKANANPTKVKGELAKIGLVPTGDWGGDTEVIECSAITGDGIDDLLETILLSAEVMNLQENPDKKATGFVIESNKTEKEGVIATFLIKKGMLKIGDTVIAGKTFGRIRAMFDDKGKSIETVGPAYPAKILGLSDTPSPGDRFYVLDNINYAHKLADTRKINLRLEEQATKTKVTAENLLSLIQAGEVIEVNLVIKGDTVGSIEVLKAQIGKLVNKEVKTNIIRAAVGAITENDVLLASSAQAIVIGFHVLEETEVKRLAKSEQIEIRHFRVIYELIDFVKGVLEGQLAPEKIEHKLGRAEIRKIFFSSKLGNIAGCFVSEGVARRNAKVRLYRNGKEISPESGYSLSSLKQVSDDAKEVKKGFECGMVIENFSDIKIGDIIEFYEFEERKRKLADVE